MTTKAIEDAWQKEGSLTRLGLRPAANRHIQKALVPPGGDWQCVAPEGAMTRSVTWNGTEVALVNPRGGLSDSAEGEIAMGLRATPAMDKALRVIFVLAQDPANCALIADIARAAIDYVEQPAPRWPQPDDESEDESDEPYESEP